MKENNYVHKIISRIVNGASAIIFCVTMFSCGNKTANTIVEVEQPTEIQDITNIARAVADSLLNTMTLEEKVGQCLMPSLYSKDSPATIRKLKEYISDYHIGGVVLLKGDSHSARRLSEIADSASIPLFVALDAEWGLGMRLTDAPTYPMNGKMAKDLEDTELYDYGREIAKESRAAGINMILGPVVDIVSNPRSAIGNRSFGKDPEMVSNYAVAYARGLESGGVISVAKHFPGHGGALHDSHTGVAKIYKGISDLDTVDLKPFRDYIDAGLNGVMAGHIQSIALDPDGNPASVSIDMLTSLLREEMGFKGLILTDAFSMGGAKGFSAINAINAGADLVLSPSNVEKEYNGILESIKENREEINVINDRVRKILFTKYLFGIIP